MLIFTFWSFPHAAQAVKSPWDIQGLLLLLYQILKCVSVHKLICAAWIIPK